MIILWLTTDVVVQPLSFSPCVSQSVKLNASHATPVLLLRVRAGAKTLMRGGIRSAMALIRLLSYYSGHMLSLIAPAHVVQKWQLLSLLLLLLMTLRPLLLPLLSPYCLLLPLLAPAAAAPLLLSLPPLPPPPVLPLSSRAVSNPTSGSKSLEPRVTRREW